MYLMYISCMVTIYIMAIQCMALIVYIELDVVLRMCETSVCARVQLLVGLLCVHHNRTTKYTFLRPFSPSFTAFLPFLLVSQFFTAPTIIVHIYKS